MYTTQQQQKRIRKRRKEEEEEALGGGRKEEGGSFLFPYLSYIFERRRRRRGKRRNCCWPVDPVSCRLVGAVKKFFSRFPFISPPPFFASYREKRKEYLTYSTKSQSSSVCCPLRSLNKTEPRTVDASSLFPLFFFSRYQRGTFFSSPSTFLRAPTQRQGRRKGHFYNPAAADSTI